MRILFISHYDNLYGANRALLTLMLRLKAEGRHEPYLVIPAEGGISDILTRAGIECFICPVTQWQAIYHDPFSFALKKHKRKKSINEELTRIYEHFKDKKIDLIHSNSSVIGTGAMLAEKLHCRHVWHIREFAKEHYGMRYFYPDDTVSRYYKAADKLILISDALKEYYDRLYPGAKTVRIYDGIEPAEKPENRADTEETVFIYTGYLFPKKRQLDALKAAALLKEEGINRFKLILAGSGDKAYRQELERFIREHDLKEAELKGFVEDVPGLLKKCDVGIIASEYEGFGLVTVEYMLNGMPVIGFRSGATPEIIKDGATGILYDDVQGLKEAMKKLIADRDIRRHMGDEAYKRASERFSAEENPRGVMNIYEETEGDMD